MVRTLASPREMVEARRVSVTDWWMDGDVDGLGQIDTAKHDAGVGRRGAQRQLHRPPLQAHAHQVRALRVQAVVMEGLF